MYRLEQEFNRQGLTLSRQTMANWLLKASEKWLQSVYDALHKRLCKEPVLHADETTLQVLKEPGRSSTSKSYMWLYRTSGCAKQAIVLYEYQPTRKAEHAEAFLKDFSGWLHADGYQGYRSHCEIRKPAANERKPEHFRLHADGCRDGADCKARHRAYLLCTPADRFCCGNIFGKFTAVSAVSMDLTSGAIHVQDILNKDI